MTDKNANKIGYKKTKLGWIPEDWIVDSLGNIGELKNGISKGGENFGYGTPIIGLNDIFGKIYISQSNPNSLVNATSKELKDFNIRIGDVLFVRSSVKPEGVGMPCVIEKDLKDTTFSGFLIRFRETKHILNNKYKRYCFLLDSFRYKLLAKSTISANTNINQPSLASLNIIIPPLKEQEKIAEVLSCWDDGIEVLEKLLEKKQLHKKALMQGLLSGKIPLKNSKKNNSYKKTILGEIPSNWTVVKLKNIFTRLEEKNSKKNMLPVLTNSATQGVIYQNEYFDRSIVSETNTNNYYIVYPNAFMYNPRISKNAPAGPINKNKLGEIGIASPLYTIFYSKNDLCNSFYELYFNTNLWNKYMLNVANQGARHDRLNVTTKDFINMPLPCPPINEQQEIVEVLSSYDEEIKLLDKKLEMLKLQKKGLMQKLLTGEIRVKI